MTPEGVCPLPFLPLPSHWGWGSLGGFLKPSLESDRVSVIRASGHWLTHVTYGDPDLEIRRPGFHSALRVWPPNKALNFSGLSFLICDIGLIPLMLSLHKTGVNQTRDPCGQVSQ